MVHVWQAQTRGRWYLVLMRHPFAAYSYGLKPGWRLDRYGLEQQAEIVRHYWLLTQGVTIAGAPGVEAYRAVLPLDRKSVVEGKSVSVRVDLGGGRYIKKQKNK